MPDIAVRSWSDMWAGRWTVVLPAVQRGPAIVSALPCRHPGCPQRRTPRPLSTADTAAAGGVRLAAELDTRGSVRCPPLLPEPRPVSGRPVSTASTADSRAAGCGRRPTAAGGCRHRRKARASWRPSRSPAGRARRSSPAAPRPGPPRWSARPAAGPAGRRVASRPPPRGRPPGVDPDLGPGVSGPGAQLHGQVGEEHQLPGAPSQGARSPARTAASRLAVERKGAAARPGRPTSTLPAGRRIGPGAAEVAVRHPARLQDLAVGVAAEPCHRPSPAGGWWAPGYPARRRRLTVRTCSCHVASS
jgi:hypothetical protein